MCTVPLIAIGSQSDPLEALREWLLSNTYSPRTADRICRHTARHGTPTGCYALDREDEPTATEVYIEAMPAVALGDAAWDDDGVLLDSGMLAAGVHPWPMPDEPGDSDRSIPPGVTLFPPELDPEAEDTGEFPPPAQVEPYDPTDEDLDDYRRWLAETEARGLTLAVEPFHGPPPIRGGAPAPMGGFRRIVAVEGGKHREEPVDEAEVRSALAEAFGEPDADRLIGAMRAGRKVDTAAARYIFDPYSAEVLALPKLSGGSPASDGPTAEDVEEMHRYCDHISHMEELDRQDRLEEECRRWGGR